MQFKHPELLYALFLLVIPIIVHLFQLRRFKKEAFTNVAFLKMVIQQTRKSAQLKKWLLLCTRLLLLTAAIIAFAQPFIANNHTINSKTETIIYLDNSFSMQAKGTKGELLKRAVQDIISYVDENEPLSLITNNTIYNNTSVKAIKNDLLELSYTPNQLDYKAVLLKSKSLFTENNSLKRLIFISDFQQKQNLFTPLQDANYLINAVVLQPVNINNVALDSIYLKQTGVNNAELYITLKTSGKITDNVSVAFYNNEQLFAKTVVSVNNNASTYFSIPDIKALKNGRIIIEDTGLQYDNQLYFNINIPEKINVLAINDGNDNFLKRLFTDDEFLLSSVSGNQLNYNDINKQNLIILNELETLSTALTTALQAFVAQGGYLIIIPPKNNNAATHNSLLNTYGTSYNNFRQTEKHITNITFDHPIFQDVFENRIKNFQYPNVSEYYTLTSNGSPLLKFEDGSPFLSQFNNRVFVFTAPINKAVSNFQNSDLIVAFYAIAKKSLKNPKLYYTIGNTNTFDVNVTIQPDAVLKLVSPTYSFIPQQHYFNQKVSITTTDLPEIADIYSVNNNNHTLKNVSYNYNRNESILHYQNLSETDSITVFKSLKDIINQIKNESNINALWQWFVILALVFLIIEMLILKIFK